LFVQSVDTTPKGLEVLFHACTPEEPGTQ
jgi:hypothetical protein